MPGAGRSLSALPAAISGPAWNGIAPLRSAGFATPTLLAWMIDALHAEGFFIAIESNGTLAVPRAIDWICISPKARSETVQRSGDELKLVWPQQQSDWEDMQNWDFANLLLQPMDARGDDAASQAHLEQAIAFVQAHPKWRLSLQNHKILGLA